MARTPGRTLAVALLLTAALAAAAEKGPPVVDADLAAVRAEIRKPGARAVLVNVWATFCEPCREEMPALLKVARARRDRGLRLLLVSADDADARPQAQRFLASLGVDFPTYLKTGDDMAFINGLEPRWSGALPASFLFDGQGHLRQFWPGPVTAATLAPKLDELLRAGPKAPRP